jgi:hypothetical protein
MTMILFFCCHYCCGKQRYCWYGGGCAKFISDLASKEPNTATAAKGFPQAVYWEDILVSQGGPQLAVLTIFGDNNCYQNPA